MVHQNSRLVPTSLTNSSGTSAGSNAVVTPAMLSRKAGSPVEDGLTGQGCTPIATGEDVGAAKDDAIQVLGWSYFAIPRVARWQVRRQCRGVRGGGRIPGPDGTGCVRASPGRHRPSGDRV